MNWSGRRVLVTGAGGFIGSHLTEKLVSMGAETHAFAHYRSDGSYGLLDRSEFRKDIVFHAGDVCDRDSVAKAVAGADFVFHLAALISIPFSYQAPESFVRTNILGSLNVAMACRDAGVERMIHTSTSEVYGTAVRVPIAEDHPLQGQSPYSASKIGADKLLESLHLSHSFPVVTVRPFNTYGPRQTARAVIPTIISQVIAGDTVRIGNSRVTRDFNYIDDTVAGFLRAAECKAAVGRVINIGSGREIRIDDLIRLIAAIVNRPIDIAVDSERLRPEASEVERLWADNSLAGKLLNWSPAVSIEDGLAATVDWIREHLNEFEPGLYVI